MGPRDHLNYPYPSRRTVVFARNGMVAASQPLAAQAGLAMLRRGGNAVDAAVATAACLTVVEPTSNGIGGDAFALIWHAGKLHCLNASGPAPRGISLERMRETGYTEMPALGFAPVTVPGAPAAWAECSRRFGRLPFADLLQPAIEYAAGGYPITPVLGRYWQRAAALYRERLKGEEFRHWFVTFAPGGRAPKPGELWRSPGHAATLQSIAETAAVSFYRGEPAARMADFAQAHGGYLSADDLEEYAPLWVEPISAGYRGFEVWEPPPNGQGLITLMALKILERFDFGSRDDAAACHRQIEALKLAFADGLAYITDPESMAFPAGALLTGDYIEGRRALMGESAAAPAPGPAPRGGTVYLAAADGEGGAVSFIQSNYMGFGSGLVVPGTGIALQNRGHSFSLDPHHANRLEPGKRPYHTIMPGFLTRQGQAIGPFGVMGGFMQPQGHLQVLMNMIDFGLNPQAALDAPRWQWIEGRRVAVEGDFPAPAVQGLRDRGHHIEIAPEGAPFGRGQIIWRDSDSGVLAGGTDPRADGSIAAW